MHQGSIDAALPTPADKIRSIAFLNLAHAIDHFVLLIFPAVVLGLETVFERPYEDMIALSTAGFVAFGVFALPAGWLADRWSRRNMMALFFFGCGVSLFGAAAAPTTTALALTLGMLGVFAAIYHPVGMAMLIEVSKARPRTLAFNGVCGNLGVTLAPGLSAMIAQWFGWRAAFLVPAALCVAIGLAYLALVVDDRAHHRGQRSTTANVALSPHAALAMLASYIVISLAGGLTFNTATIALPKLINERGGADLTLVLVGWLATGIFLCGALAQLAVGRLVERFPPHLMFAAVATMQFVGLMWVSYATGAALVVALALSFAAIYAQVTVGDIVISRYIADAWRGRIFAVRYFLTFVAAGVAVELIAQLYGRGGFNLVLAAVAATGLMMLIGVYAMATVVHGAEAAHRASQPAE
jgi:MFS family permease